MIQGPGWLDDNTCDSLITVYPGENYGARIGDTAYTTGTGKASELRYSITVSSQTYLFVYRYAIVLQNGNHAAEIQPDFKVMITDGDGEVLDSTCGYYHIVAPPTGSIWPGWHSCITNVSWKDWTTVGMNLSPYFGQTVNIIFKVRGCTYNTHFGYAYISAYCSYLELQTALCEGQDSAVLTAPPGFSYYWLAVTGNPSINGDTTASITVPSVEGASYQCTLTAANGCIVTISNILHYTQIHTGFTQSLNCAERPSSFIDTTWVSQNQVVAWRWFFGDPASGAADSSHLQSPTHSFTQAGNYNVTLISYSTEGCCDTAVKQVSIDSLPDISNDTLRKYICSKSSTNISLTSTVSSTLFTWTAEASSTDLTGFSDNAIPATEINQILINNGNKIDSVTYTITPQNTTCSGDDTTFNVIVYPLPVLSNSPLVKSICDSTATNIDLESNNDTTRFTWTCSASSVNVTGYSANTSSPDTLIDQILRNTGFAIDTVYYHILPQSYGCFGDTVTYKVAVYPVPDLSNTPAIQQQCDGQSTGLTLQSHVANTTFTWRAFASSANVTGYSGNTGPGVVTINQTLVNNGTGIDTVTYRLMPMANGCHGDSTDYRIVVFPTPELSNSPALQSQCNNLQTNIALTSVTANTTFTWRAFITAGTITGYSSNPGPGAVLINDLLVNTGYTIDTVYYRLEPLANGCSGDSVDFKVAVYPTPDLSNTPASQAQCNGQSTALTLLSNVTNTTFTWNAYPSSANITGWSDNVGPGTTTIAQVLLNSGSSTETVTYRLLPAANNCLGDSTDFLVTVYPTPDLSNTILVQSQCNNQQTGIALVSSVSGATFTWRAFATSANLSGFSSNSGPGATQINQTLVNSGYTIDTVYYRILPSANNCTGDSIDYKVAVYPTPDLSTTPLSKQICNENNTLISLTSTVAGTLFTWTVTPGAGNISGYSENTTSPASAINQQLFLTGVVPDSIFYNITPHANGCAGPVYNYEVTVNPFPLVTNHPMYDTICDLNSPLLNLEATCDGSTFVWIGQLGFGNVTGFANGAGPVIDQILDNHITTPGEVQYIVTPSSYGCPGPDTTFYILVIPTAQLTNSPSGDTICSGETTAVGLLSNVSPVEFIWTCEASSANLSGFSDNLIPTDSIKQTVFNSGYTIETVTYHVIPITDECNGDTTDFVLWVNPIPDLSNNPLFSELCNGTSTNIGLLSNVTGATFSWTATPSSVNITGWGPGSGLLIDQVLTNTGFVTENVTYHITPSANGCVGTITDFVATVFSSPDVYFDPAAQTICSEDTSSIQVLSHVTVATFTWTAAASSPNLTGYSNGSGPLIEQPVTNTGNTIETVTYTATPEAFGCPAGIPQSVILTVNPTPHLTTTPLNQSICTGTSTNIPLTSTVTGSTFAWTTAASSGNLSGYADGSGALINQNITNSGFTIETVTYTITPTANSCPGPDSIYTVTIFPRPDMANNPPDTAICNGETTGVTLISHVTGTQFTWTATGSSLFVTGFSDNVIPATILDQTLINSGYFIETVTYQVIPHANGCDGFDTSFVVTVFPVPDVSNIPMNKEICNNNNTDVDLTSHTTGTLFTWTASGSSANITGFTDNITPSAHIGDNLINTGDINETVTYHLTPHANGCDGITVDYTVTVVPSPYLTNIPLNASICDHQSTGLVLQSNVAGTQFSWTCTPSSANISGYSNSIVPGTLIDQILVNSGFNTESVTYHITPENSGCPGSVTDYTFMLFPVPDVYFVPNGETICEGEVTNLSLQSHVTGTTYSWTASASSPDLSGFSDGSGNLIAQTINNNGFTIAWVTYQVTPAANGCPPGSTLPVIATVNPLPVVTANPSGQSICNGQVTNLSLQADVSGSSFAWRAFSSSPNITGFSNGSGFIIAHTLINSGYGIDSVIYRVAATANGCTGDSTDFVVVVFPVADVIFTPSGQALCSGETTGLNLTSNVANTSFSWTASGSSPSVSGFSNGSGSLIQQTLINSGYLIPTVTYLVTPVANGCMGTQNSVTVAVNPWPVVSLMICYDTLLTTESVPFTLHGGIPPGGTYAGTGVSNGRFYPALADTGRHTITYYYSNTYGCDAIDSIFIRVVEPAAHSCGDTLFDIRDSRKYPTVTIATQCWMTSDLNYGTVLASSQAQRDNCTPEKYCINDNPANCTNWGGLYQWNEVMQYTSDNGAQGFCPPGWHIPSETDWNTLFSFYISNGFAGNALKSSGYSGFNALLTGIRFHNTVWKFTASDPVLRSKLYWSSSLHAPDKSWAHGMNEVVANTEYTPSVSFYPALHSNAFSIRCLKD